MAALTPDIPQVEQHIVNMTNQVRSDQRLQELKINKMLADAARAYAEKLARSGAFSHNADGRDPGQRAAAAGYRACAIAENLAMNRSAKGFATGALAAETIAGWMNSPAHRANMLMNAASEIGVGVAGGEGGRFISVELLGRPVSQSFRFEIVNALDADARYTFAGRTHALKARVSVTHTSCAPGELVFSAAGSGPFSAAMEIARMPAAEGGRYTLKRGADGKISVETSKRADQR